MKVTHWAYQDDDKTIRISTLGQTVVEVDRETGAVSDGYHTFDELYRYRMLYNAALFRQWHEDLMSADGPGYEVHKSWRHSDGEDCFGGGWFIVMATLPTGQISNRYEARYWDLFDIPERDRADEYDGHSPADVADRIERWLKGER